VPLDPVSAEAENCLGLDQQAEALAEFIAECATPMTIGLQGGWGTGKSSLMNLIKARLQILQKKREAHCIHLEFNTWQYSQLTGKDRLPVSLMWNLVRKLKHEHPSGEWKSVAMRFAKSLTVAAGSIATGSLAGAGLAIDVGKAVAAFQDDSDNPDEARLLEQLREDFEKIIRESLKAQFKDAEDARVVVYVDDLDRLEPVRAIELLEVVKNVLDVPGCVFVLAIDYDVIVRGLRQQKGYDLAGFDEDEGRDFFAKIIQLP
jgi:predicted KAP-like P-loop ATPase